MQEHIFKNYFLIKKLLVIHILDSTVNNFLTIGFLWYENLSNSNLKKHISRYFTLAFISKNENLFQYM